MVQYKWIALTNTTIGVFMAMVNGTIILISFPTIFKGINLDPNVSGNFVYLLWILMGYNIVTATLLVTFGKLSDMFGRTRLFNLGFVVFTVGSLLLFLTPSTGILGADELIIFRLFQGVGAAFLFSNSAAILTDAFPADERGMALGLNQVAALAGSFIGLVIGGILSVINWRLVFLVSVPFGALGSVWSIIRLKDISVKKVQRHIDYFGNLSFAGGLTLLLIGVTYGLINYDGSPMGWGNPWVILSLVLGSILLVAFPFVEAKVRDPMFHMSLFKIRAFGMGNLASFMASIGRGGVMLMLIILLQGIWLPLHGYSYSSTPFWAGVAMLPMTVGFFATGPLSGWLSDRYGAKELGSLGMVIAAVSFLLLSSLPYGFNYWEFALILFMLGAGSGMFAAPNTAAIMNSVPPEERGVASGMRATIMNVGQTASLGLFFTLVIASLSSNLSGSMLGPLATAGVPAGISPMIDGAIGASPTAALFSMFLGYNPMQTVVQQLSNLYPSYFAGYGTTAWYSTITGKSWFPNALAPPFMSALSLSFLVGAALSVLAAAASFMRGKKYVHGLDASAEPTDSSQ